MSGTLPETADALAMLRWQIDMGADEAIDEYPIDRTAIPAAVPMPAAPAPSTAVQAPGEAPRPEDYQRRFPALDAAWLARAVDTPARAAAAAPGPAPQPRAAEEPPTWTRPRTIHCPHCHHTLELVGEQAEEVLCPGCGGSFHVQDTRSTTTTGEPRRLGKFQLLEQVGVGAFGTVWRARDRYLG